MCSDFLCLHFSVYSMFFMIPFVFFMLVLILVNTIMKSLFLFLFIFYRDHVGLSRNFSPSIKYFVFICDSGIF